MTSAQIAYLIAQSGEPNDSPAEIKYVGLGSGKGFSVQSSPGVAGRYALAFDDANELASFTPTAQDSTSSGVVAAVEYVSYDSIESISLFPAGS